MLTEKLAGDQIDRLYYAIRETLHDWTQRLRDEVGDGAMVGLQVGRQRYENDVHAAKTRDTTFAGVIPFEQGSITTLSNKRGS